MSLEFYCTVADFLSVADLYRADANPVNKAYTGGDGSLPQSQILGYIRDATDEVRYILLSRFNLNDIEAMVPLPLPIIQLTKFKAYDTALQSRGAAVIETNMGIRNLLQGRIIRLIDQLKFGVLLTPDNVEIPPNEDVLLTRSIEATEIDALYVNGPRGFGGLGLSTDPE